MVIVDLFTLLAFMDSDHGYRKVACIGVLVIYVEVWQYVSPCVVKCLKGVTFSYLAGTKLWLPWLGLELSGIFNNMNDNESKETLIIAKHVR